MDANISLDSNQSLIGESSVLEATCQICNSRLPKYRCPACSIRTCSLDCVKKHKIEQSCSGVATAYSTVNSVKSYNEKELIKDYRYLEQTNRFLEGTGRLLCQHAIDKTFANQHRCSSAGLRKLCEQRNTKLKIAPGEMTRRKENTTSIKKNKILWRLKWMFPSCEVSHTDQRISEENTLEFLMQRFYRNNWISASLKKHLKPLLELGIKNINLLIIDHENHQINQYFLLDLKQKLRLALNGKTVIEYPEIIVIPKDSIHQYKCLVPQVSDESIENTTCEPKIKQPNSKVTNEE